jgi:hypothetical protein
VNPAGSKPALFFRVPDLLLLAAGLLTAAMAVRTFWYLFHSITNVPYTDGWVILDEVRRFREGAGWTSLWQPYWGQRNLTARLLFLLSEKYSAFRSLPLILVNVGAQCILLAVLIQTAHRVLRDSLRAFFACAIVFTNLVFSPLGMEVLVITQNVQHSVGYASAICSILLFTRRPWLGVCLAILATASVAIGLVVWPILLIEAWHGRMRVRTVVTVTGLTVAMGVLYAIGYSRPPSFGMGVMGALLHPWMTGLILGGPITLFSLRLGTIAGVIGLGTLAYLVWFGKRAAFPLAMAACFLAASSASLVAGRISPEWIANLHGAQPLPSRYIAPVLVFWACLFALALTQRQAIPRIAAGLIVLILAFGTWTWQWRVSREWAVAFQKFDAIASGFLVGVSDPELMDPLLSDPALRSQMVDYQRSARLGIFTEPRASWIGKPLPLSAEPRSARLDTVTMPDGLRVAGTVGPSTRDLLLVGPGDIVIGLARTLPAQSKGNQGVDFLGYAKTSATVRVFALPQ